MSWLRRAPSPEKVAVDEALKVVEAEREKRRSALRHLTDLMKKLDEIPLDDGLEKIGDDIARTPRGGH